MNWHCSTKDDVVELFRKAGKPLNAEMLLDLDDVDAELQAEQLARSFAVIAGQCRICSHRQLIIVPEVVDLDNLECGNCEHYTMMERETPDWEQEE